MISPWKPSSSSTRVCADGVAAYALPTAICSGMVSAGTSWPIRRVLGRAEPVQRGERVALAACSHASPSSVTPLASSSLTVRFHSGRTRPSGARGVRLAGDRRASSPTTCGASHGGE